MENLLFWITTQLQGKMVAVFVMEQILIFLKVYLRMADVKLNDRK